MVIGNSLLVRKNIADLVKQFADRKYAGFFEVLVVIIMGGDQVNRKGIKLLEAKGKISSDVI